MKVEKQKSTVFNFPQENIKTEGFMNMIPRVHHIRFSFILNSRTMKRNLIACIYQEREAHNRKIHSIVYSRTASDNTCGENNSNLKQKLLENQELCIYIVTLHCYNWGTTKFFSGISKVGKIQFSLTIQHEKYFHKK